MHIFIKILSTLGSLVLILFSTGCVSMALEAMKKIPSQDDVSQMKIGETRYDDVSKKWPDFQKNLVNEKICLAYTKVNTAAQLGVIGGKADIVTLCFKDGLLTDRTSN